MEAWEGFAIYKGMKKPDHPERWEGIQEDFEEMKRRFPDKVVDNG